jgi:hypothetical protein
LQTATVLEDVAVWPRLNPKSKLGFVGGTSSNLWHLSLLGITRRGGCDGCVFLSLIVAVSTACLSYLSHISAVDAGAGDCRESIEGDEFLVSPGDCCDAGLVMVEVYMM